MRRYKKDRKYYCDHCEYQSHYKSNVSKHIQAKHLRGSIDLYKCNKCSKSYWYQTSLLKHSKICGLSESSLNSLILYCDCCEYKTFEKNNLVKHIKHKHLPLDLKTHKCGKCGKFFLNLKQHLRICGLSKDMKHSLKRFSCDDCNKKYFNKYGLAQHIKANHLSPHKYLCKCGKNFSADYALYVHRKICELPENLMQFSCEHCDFKCRKKSRLSSHFRMYHLPEDLKRSLPRFNCNHCEYKSAYKSNLAKHIQNKHLPRSRSHKCNQCKKAFLHSSTLLKHSKICGKPEDYKRSLLRYSCDQCNFKSDSKSLVDDHVRARHLPRIHNLNKCNKCEKNFAFRSILLKHSKICGLSDELKISFMHSCDRCEYKTLVKGNLNRHIRYKHLPRNKSNDCNKCGKSFADLRQHSKTCGLTEKLKRSVKRQYTCDYCNHKYFTKNKVAEHISEKHLTGQSFSKNCSKCGKNIRGKWSFSAHFKRCGATRDLMRFSCADCNYKSFCKGNLSKHVHIHLKRQNGRRRGINKHKCKKCAKSFAYQQSLHRHSKTCTLDD